MDFNDIVYIFLLLAFLFVSTLIKGIKALLGRKKKKGKARGLFHRLQTLLEQWEAQAVAQKEEKGPEEMSDFWEELAENETGPVEDPQGPEKEDPFDWFEGEEPIGEMAEASAPMPAHPAESRTDTTPVKKPEPEPAQPQAAPKPVRHGSGQSLQSALVWSEILGPPVALRREISGGKGE